MPLSDRLKISLDYYKGHAALLAKGAYKTLGTEAKVTAFQKHGSIPLADFLNYFFIRRHENPCFATYAARIEQTDTAIQTLKHITEIGRTINSREGCNGTQEQIGEAISLSVANELFGLTAADWIKIPEQKGKKAQPTFDFENTITGITKNNSIVQIEAKGSIVSDNTLIQPAIRTHASSIAKKKKKIAAAADQYTHPANARYGMIVAIDEANDAKCWLLDPPADDFEGSPQDLKVAARLDYVAEIVSLLAPRAKLPSALREKAELWRAGADSKKVESLDGFPFTSENYVEAYLAKGKTWLKKQDIVGQLYIGKENNAFFLGMRGDMIRSAIQQNSEKILETLYKPTVEHIEITAEPITINGFKKSSSRTMLIQLYTSTSGVVIGLPNGYWNSNKK